MSLPVVGVIQACKLWGAVQNFRWSLQVLKEPVQVPILKKVTAESPDADWAS